MASFVFARQTCTVNWHGSAVRLVKGAAWSATDAFVKARPEFFNDEPSVVHGTRTSSRKADRPIEDTTAEPGKKRSTK